MVRRRTEMRPYWDAHRRVLELMCDTKEEAQVLRRAMQSINVDNELPFNDLRVLDWDGPSEKPTLRLGPVNK